MVSSLILLINACRTSNFLWFLLFSSIPCSTFCTDQKLRKESRAAILCGLLSIFSSPLLQNIPMFHQIFNYLTNFCFSSCAQTATSLQNHFQRDHFNALLYHITRADYPFIHPTYIMKDLTWYRWSCAFHRSYFQSSRLVYCSVCYVAGLCCLIKS